MSKYVIVSNTVKDPETKLPLYWSTHVNAWVVRKEASVFDKEARRAFLAASPLPDDSGWELSEDSERKYRFKCPRCKHPVFEEVQVDVVVSTKFCNVTFYPEEDFMEPDYGDVENTGGVINRYQCDSCGHVVATEASELREWIKQNGVVCL